MTTMSPPDHCKCSDLHWPMRVSCIIPSECTKLQPHDRNTGAQRSDGECVQVFEVKLRKEWRRGGTNPVQECKARYCKRDATTTITRHYHCTEPGTDPSSNQILLLSLFGDFKDGCCDQSSASDESDTFSTHLDDILPIWLAAIMEYIIAATLETPSTGVRTADYQYAAR